MSDLEEADHGGVYFGAAPNIEIRGQKLEKGKRYKLEGYESGEFVGTPAWVAKEKPNEQPFRFQTFFVVTKVIEVGPQDQPKN